MTAVDRPDEGRCSGEGCWYTLPVVDGLVVAHSAPMTLDDCEGSGRPPRPRSTPWRVGQHYGIHVYEGDRPVATSHRSEDAERAVAAVNAAESTGDTETLQRVRNEVTELAGLVNQGWDVSGRDVVARLRAALDGEQR